MGENKEEKQLDKEILLIRGRQYGAGHQIGCELS